MYEYAYVTAILDDCDNEAYYLHIIERYSKDGWHPIEDCQKDVESNLCEIVLEREIID